MSQDEFFNQLGPKKQKKSTIRLTPTKPNADIQKQKKRKIHILSKQEHKLGFKTTHDGLILDPNRTNTKLQDKIGIPNILTLIRFMLVVPFIICLSIPLFYWGDSTVAGVGLGTNVPSYSNPNASLYLFLTSGVIFVIAMITDFYDGRIARKNKIVTTFGKIFDPIADKIVIVAAFIFLSLYGIVPFYITIIVILRDLIVDGLRMVATNNNVVVSASKLGKWKTVCFSFGIAILFFVVPFWSYWSIEHHLFSPVFPGIAGWTHRVDTNAIWFDPTAVKLGWMLNYAIMLPIFAGTGLALVSAFNYFKQIKHFINLRAYIDEDNSKK